MIFGNTKGKVEGLVCVVSKPVISIKRGSRKYKLIPINTRGRGIVYGLDGFGSKSVMST